MSLIWPALSVIVGVLVIQWTPPRRSREWFLVRLLGFSLFIFGLRLWTEDLDRRYGWLLGFGSGLVLIALTLATGQAVRWWRGQTRLNRRESD